MQLFLEMRSTVPMNKKLGNNSAGLFNFQKNIDNMLAPSRVRSMETDVAHTINTTANCNQDLTLNNVQNSDSNGTQNLTSVETECPIMTYRQKRRIESAEKEYTGRRRGPSRALGPRRERLKMPGFKPTATITESLLRIVGPNAANFNAECSNWVKHYCPLNARSWIKMDAIAKQNLFDKIKGEWQLPTGPHVERALTIQCSQLYRQWRYKLKELHFVGKTQQQALKNCPPEVNFVHWRWLVVDYWGNEKTMDISAKNRENRGKKKLKVFNGSLSTVRILDSMRCPSITEQSNVKSTGQDDAQSNQVPEEPEYIRLWEKTKKKKDGTWDVYANAKYEEFKKLHVEEVAEHGEDNLTVEEAYARVFPGTGYIIGLGAGPRYSKKDKSLAEELNNLANERHAQLTQKFEKMIQDSEIREAFLQDEIDSVKAIAMKNEKEAKEREQMLKDDIAGMKDQLEKALQAFKGSQMTRL